MRQVREGMKMMGMSDLALFSSWYCTYILLFGVVALLVGLVTSATLFPHSSAVLLFIYFLFFGAASTAVCFFVRYGSVTRSIALHNPFCTSVSELL